MFISSWEGLMTAGSAANETELEAWNMAVLSGDLFSCPEEEIPLIESELTIIGGRIVYRK